MHWKGLFKIVKKINRMNYQIDLGHRKQTFHRKYYRRELAAFMKEIGDHDYGEIFEVVAVAVIQDDVDMDPEMDENNSEELL